MDIEAVFSNPDRSRAAIGAFLADLLDHDDETPVPSLAENMKRLLDEKRRIAFPPEFVCGHWVTPRADVLVKGHGEPHLVFDVEDNKRVRVISVVGDQICARWLDNWMLETWDQAKHDLE